MSRRKSGRASTSNTVKYTSDAFFGDVDFGEINSDSSTEAPVQPPVDDSGSGSDGSVFQASEASGKEVASSSDEEEIEQVIEEEESNPASPVLSDIVEFEPLPPPAKASTSKINNRTETSAVGKGTARKRNPAKVQPTKAARHYREGGSAFSGLVREKSLYIGSRLPNHEKGYGLFVEQETLKLEQPFNQQGKGGVKKVEVAGELGRAVTQDYWAGLPYGPTWDMCEDVGWWKGKSTQRERWGGWYDEVPSSFEEVQILPFEQAIPYFPLPVYANRKKPIYLPIKIPTNETAAGRKEAAKSKAEELLATPATDDSQMDIDNSAPSQSIPPTQDLDEPEDLPDGSITCYLGLMDETQPNAGQQLVRMERFSALRLNAVVPNKPGFMFNAGAPVWTVDWCPQADYAEAAPKEYLAVGTLSTMPPIGDSARLQQPVRRGLIQIWSMDCSNPAEFARSLPDDDSQLGEGMKYELGICTDFGEAWRLAWIPRGGDQEKIPAEGEVGRLGVLAGVFTDGAVHFISVPKPDALKTGDGYVTYLQAKALLTLRLPDTATTCMAFCSPERIVTGSDNGHVAVWDIAEALRSGFSSTAPNHYFAVHMSPIRDITVMRFPPLDPQCQEDLNGEPTMVTTAGYDGSHTAFDLRDAASALTVMHERSASFAACFMPTTGLIIIDDQEYALRGFSLRPRSNIVTLKMYAHNAPVYSIEASDFHPFFATASADGTCMIFNAMRRAKKRAHSTHFTKKLYRLDFSRKTGEFRMLDNLYPEYWSGQPKTLGSKREAPKAAHVPGAMSIEPAGATVPEIGIHCASWSKCLRRASMLASGGAAGLVRIDFTAGEPDERYNIPASRSSGVTADDEEDD